MKINFKIIIKVSMIKKRSNVTHMFSKVKKEDLEKYSLNQPPGSHYWEHKGQEDTYELNGNSQQGFTKGNLCLTSLIACCDVIDDSFCR